MSKIIFRLLTAAVVFCHVISARALNPNLPPGGNFDLSHWYIQLPTANGVLTGTAGTVDSASTPQLVAGFTNAYFYTGPDGAMTFWSPDNGATTSGSTHPRSELRELLNTNDTGVNWTVYGSNVMTASCVVSNVPADTGKVCIGQIHEPTTKPDGSASANNELTMIMFDLAGQKIYANVSLDGNLTSSFGATYFTGTNVALGKPINYTVTVVNGVLTITINNVTKAWNLFSGTNFQGHIAQNWDRASSNTVYFKAGSYNQTTNQCNCATDGAKVAFYALSIYHAPSITNQPVSVVGVPGSNVMLTVGAVGNGTLSYQWLLNGTNNLIGATNASLVISNFSVSNLGNYSVVVGDSTLSFNSVTSAVATVSGNFPPVISSVNLAANHASFTVSGTGQPNQPYVLWTTTSLNAPATWLPVLTNNSAANGTFGFADFSITNRPQRFYKVSGP
jgi:hypothetical protein